MTADDAKRIALQSTTKWTLVDEQIKEHIRLAKQMEMLMLQNAITDLAHLRETANRRIRRAEQRLKWFLVGTVSLALAALAAPFINYFLLRRR